MLAQRAYPLDDLPARKYTDAFERVAPRIRLARMGKTLVGRSERPEPPPWEPIGPKNVGGRTIALAVNPLDPDVIYAGSASGGVWRSDTGGEGEKAWRYVETGFPVLGVNAIVIDPADTAKVYIGTGEVYGKATSIGGLNIRTTRGSYGIGILKSNDGGRTWVKSLDWSYDQRRGVLALDIHPNDSSILFAGTSEGVYRSRDSGTTWELVLNVPMAVDIAINPVNGDTLFASCGNLGTPGDSGIYRSVDGGDTWTELDGGLPASWTGKTMLDIYAASPNVVYADVADMFEGIGLFRSLDSGDTWELLTENYPGYPDIATYQGWFSHYVAVHPADSMRVVVAGVNLFKSTDGGRTFQRKTLGGKYRGVVPIGGPEGPPDYSHVDHHAFARHPTDPNTLFLGNDGGVFETNNFGDTFAGRNGSYQTTQFYAGFSSSPVDPDIALGGLQDNNLVIYRGGPAWQRSLWGDGAMTVMNPLNPRILLASTQYCRIYRSTDGGETWKRVNSEMYDGLRVAFVAPFVQAPSDRSRMYAGRTRVFRSDDWGDNWGLPSPQGELDGNPLLSISVSPIDPDVVWAATVPEVARAGVYHSMNGGRRWRNVTNNLPDRYPVDVVAAYHDRDVAYIVFSGFGTSHLFRTTDGGQSWEDLGAGLPDIPTSAFALDPFNSNYLYVGNDFGVWFSPDGGGTWEPFTTGMPTAALVMDLSVSPANGRLRAVTHGLGVWERPLVSSAPDVSATGDGVRLLQNTPNPFNGQTHITYVLPAQTRVRLELYNTRGQKVRTLVERTQSAGYHTATLDASGLASGVYIYRLVAGNQVRSRRLLLVK